MNKLAFLSGLFKIALKLLAPLLAWLWAREEAKKKAVQQKLEQSEHDTKAWVNRPRSKRESVRRLRDAAERANDP